MTLRSRAVCNGFSGAQVIGVTHCARGDEGLSVARSGSFDLVLSDLKLPGLSGLDLAANLHGTHPLLPVIVMTAHGTTETAIEATRLGAYDYLLKPFEPAELLELVRKAVSTRRLATEPVEFGATATNGEALIGHSRGMQNLYKEVGRIAANQ